MRQLFQVGGMLCASCQAHVAKAVKAVSGVRNVEVNLITGRMTVETDDAPEMPQRIVDAVKNAGFTAEIVEEAPAPAAEVEHVFQVGGMRCASCQAHVAKAVKAVPGVRDAEVNLVTGRMTVKCGNAPDMPQKIIDVHTHVWLEKLTVPRPKDEVRREVVWPDLVARDNSIEDLQETYRLLFPGKDVSALMFISKVHSVESAKANNAYLADASRRSGWPALYYSHPTQSADEVERKIREGGFLGSAGRFLCGDYVRMLCKLFVSVNAYSASGARRDVVKHYGLCYVVRYFGKILYKT